MAEKLVIAGAVAHGTIHCEQTRILESIDSLQKCMASGGRKGHQLDGRRGGKSR